MRYHEFEQFSREGFPITVDLRDCPIAACVNDEDNIFDHVETVVAQLQLHGVANPEI